ncbi:MAG: serine/threonine-protein kinase [Anaerolineae bacterium]|nr:serine/threonine-protein kinase [Anaerolineae bacterium]
MAGSTIGRYEILSELARGGMGIIYLAHDPYVQRPVIIKVLTYQFAMEDFHREFFQKEAKIIASLEHPNIVPVYDFGWKGSQPYIVMRYISYATLQAQVAGGSLEDKMKTEQLKLSEMSKIIQRVCAALDAAHARNIIHRDIKPANILFDVDNHGFLADFGIAKTKSDAEEEWLLGTPSYMSPEQCLDQKLDGRSDVYALGILLYEVLTGQLPFKGANNDQVMSLQVNQPAPSILDSKPDLPVFWAEIVSKAMEKSPDDRYSSAGELGRDVRDLVSGRWYMRKL